MITIRRATANDLDWIVSELKKFAHFYQSNQFLVAEDSDYVRSNLLNMFNQHLFLVAEKDGVGLVGLIAGLYVRHFFNPNIRLLSETFWWVPEEHRGSRAGLMLLEAFTEWGKENADWITFALEENSPVKDKCLLNRGYRLQERSYLMEVQ